MTGFLTCRLATAICATSLAVAVETIPGPESPAVQVTWLANLTAWREATLASIHYNGVWEWQCCCTLWGCLQQRYMHRTAHLPSMRLPS